MKIYRPNKKKIIRDFIIIASLILISISINSKFSFDNLLIPIVFVALIALIYVFLMGILPFIEIDSKGIKYRSDYGVTHHVDISKIKRITKGSGLGGYEHAIFVYYEGLSGKMNNLKIKSSYFNRTDLVNFIDEVRQIREIETNPELDQFMNKSN